MGSFFDLLHNTTSSFHEISLTGLKKEIGMYHIDFSRGETDSSRLFVLPRGDLSRNDAFIVLIQRLFLVMEDLTDYEQYDSEDLARWTEVILNHYASTEYLEEIHPDSDEDNAFFLERLNSNNEQIITYNNRSITHQVFKHTCPLFTESLLSVSKSKFKRLESEFYIETENYYLLYNWYTTA